MEPVTATIRCTRRGYAPPAWSLSTTAGTRSARTGKRQSRPRQRAPSERGPTSQLRPRQRAPSGMCPAAGRGSERQETALAASCLRTKRSAPSRSRLRPAHPIDLRRSDCRAGGPSSFGAPCSVQSESYPRIPLASSSRRDIMSQIATNAILSPTFLLENDKDGELNKKIHRGRCSLVRPTD